MPYIDEILSHNKKFVEKKEFLKFDASKYPEKKIAIVTCMDTRLIELLPAALNLKGGEIKMIKNAGALIPHPFGSAMRSLLVAVYNLGVEEILVIGHEDCGMQGFEPSDIIAKMHERNIPKERIEMVKYCGIDLQSWLRGFDCVISSVHETVSNIKNHPLMPSDVMVYGFVINPATGELTKVD